LKFNLEIHQGKERNSKQIGTRTGSVRERAMGKAGITSFMVAVSAILLAAFFAPRPDMVSMSDCAPAYGIDPCQTREMVITGSVQ